MLGPPNVGMQLDALTQDKLGMLYTHASSIAESSLSSAGPAVRGFLPVPVAFPT